MLTTSLAAPGSATTGGGILDRPELAVATLEALQKSVLIADTELNLVYMNPRAVALMHSLGAEVQAAFGISTGRLLGGSIHRFHHDPHHVERVLRDPSRLPHEVEFSFGSTTLEAASTPSGRPRASCSATPSR